jgi:site-specific DNA recombinase
MECVAYVRVSTDEQVQGTSLDMQQKACFDFAKAQGWKLPKDNIFRDEGESAKAANRPQLLAMLEYCRRHKGSVEKCIVWKLDRFARNSDDHVMIRAILRKNGVSLVSVTEPIDDSPTGKLMETVLSGFAQFDNEVRTFRTTEGMKKRLEQGGWPHDAPIGYIKDRTAQGVTTIAPHPEMGKKLTMFLETFATGQYTVKQAADLAYELGIRNGKGGKRTWQTIDNTLKNPIYAGFIESKYTYGQRYVGLHKALISEAIFNKNQRIMAGKQKLFTRSDESDYPLRRDFLRCGYCGKFVTASAPRGASGIKYPRYSCMYCKTSILGKKVSIASDTVHDEFKKILARVQYKEGRLKVFKHIVLERWCDEYDEALKSVHQINVELEALKAERSKVNRKFTRDEISYAEKQEIIKDIDAEIADFMTKKIEADEYADQKEQIVDNAMLFIKDPSDFWNRAPVQIQKSVQRTLFPRGLSYDFENGFGTIELNESYLLLQKLPDNSTKKPIMVATSGLEPLTPGL